MIKQGRERTNAEIIQGLDDLRRMIPAGLPMTSRHEGLLDDAARRIGDQEERIDILTAELPGAGCAEGKGQGSETERIGADHKRPDDGERRRFAPEGDQTGEERKMTKSEKVIRGLECWLNDDTNCPDDDCPYMKRLICDQSAILHDALSLLKAQEPRIMTVHDWEANHVAKMPVWVEWSKSAKGECADYERADGWSVLNVDEFVDVVCFGGRCWTSRPTDEQRKEITWE